MLQRRALGRAGFSSCSPRALEHRPGSCGPRTQLFCGMWDSPTPGFVSLSLALAGEFFTTEPPGKPLAFFFIPLLRNCSIIGYRGRLMFRYNLFSFIKKFSLPGSSVHGILSGKNTGVGCHFLLQGIFLTQGSNPGLLSATLQVDSLPTEPLRRPM